MLRTTSVGIDGPVSLAVTYDESCAFEHPALRAAFEYWQKLCGDRPMPSRRDINPSAMRKFIAHVGVIDILVAADESVSYFVRVAGAEVERVPGLRSGKALLDGVPADMASRWLEPHERLRLSGKPLRGFGRIVGGKTWLMGEYLHAPLGDGDGTTSIFGAFAATPVSQ